MDERGVVRFEARHVAGPAPHHPGLDELDAWRTRLFDAGLVGLLPSGIGYGNVSVRVAGSDRFVVSGTGTGGARRLGASGYVEVSSAEPDENRITSVGPVAASSESLTHAAVYGANRRVHAVLHVHSASLWRHALGLLPATPPAVEAGTPDMARALAALAADATLPACVVMTGHADGLVAFGTRIGDAGLLLLELAAAAS